ncbi:peptidylprolyl isomerase [Roseobacter sp. CCS2]|uniref:peptidylprolyl isomerase n=1 Tax=Roseobacter sp. CCS2 TaxID=391593 RepID=UPI0000F40150|nr:peptidylprolyl isomerase [Roseobacter sp. CCS2]EBA14191.1 PpiC-type peptidyl-prolyl cis-trans isomerase [Roseobacter sp. CCS2]
MLKHVTFLGATAMATVLSTGAFAQDVTAETVVATVGDTEITMGEIIIARTQLPPQYAQLPADALFNGLVDQLIQQQLLADEADGVSAQIEYTLSNERRALIAADVITSIADNAVTEADVQTAYDARFENAEEIQEFNAAHLLVETEEEAIAAKARIDEGAAFADVARDVSTGPTGPNGGNLGWFGPGAMVPTFEEAVMGLDVGGVSEPFETQFGWHVATLLETRVQPRPTIDDLRPQIAQELQEAAITARLDELAEAQTITKPEPGEFDPALIDALELLD